MIIMDSEHKHRISLANESVKRSKKKAEKDPLRPVYHITAPANWLSDPNGAIFYKDRYHLFFQHNPFDYQWGNMSWGHVVSKDLVFWEHFPVALTPTPESYDKDGVFSGCCVDNDGVPTIIYTGVSPEVQCIADSYDGLRTWSKCPQNPVISKPPQKNLVGFRDPYVWKERNKWFMVIGSGIKNKGGTVLLYKSEDLKNWKYLHPLCHGEGEMWECPNFFRLGDKYVLIISPHGDVQYSIGTFQDDKFQPGEWFPLDLGGEENFYAPHGFKDARGRYILWGWIKGGGTQGYPWNGVLTLPRVVTLHSDQQLSINPVPELKKLRGEQFRFSNINLSQDSHNILKDIQGDCLEIDSEFECRNDTTLVLDIRCAPNLTEKTSIIFDCAKKKLTCDDKSGKFPWGNFGKKLSFQIFLDKSVVEIYMNNHLCLTKRIYPKQLDSQGLNLAVEGGNALIRHLAIWKMNSIWQESN